MWSRPTSSRCTVALTNKVPTTPVRGAGRPQAVFAMERLMDRVARELKLDRAEVRARNMIQPEQMPYAVGLIFRDGKPLVYHGGDFPKSQAARDRGVATTKASARGRPRRAARAAIIGIGIGNYVEGTGLGPFEGVTVRVLPNGKVAVATGATNQGQGTRTTLSQIVADQLGCRIEDIVMTMGDTGAISQGIGAFASRQAINAGSSAHDRGRRGAQAGGRARRARARRCRKATSTSRTAEAIARTGNKPSADVRRAGAAWRRACRASRSRPGQTPGLEHTAYFTPPQASYCNGTHVVEVEVDPMTGGVTLLNYTVAHDSGNVINPMIVDGQVQGGVAHGIGNALFEWMKYDDDANPLTTTFQDYLLPAAPRRARLQDRCTSRRRTRSTRSASRARAKAAPFRRRPRSSPRSRTRCRRSACTSPTCR